MEWTPLSIGAVIVALIILVSPRFLRKWFSKGYIASLVITVGILGTFFGVFVGLLNFDSEDITTSVPLLIDGLKTAFLTSIAGLLANILVRTVPQIYKIKEVVTGKKSDNLGEQIIASMNKVASSISSESDTSIVTQLQKIRVTNSDGFTSMKDSFDEFADKMIEDNSQSLIDALTQVMKDFNTKINEQFGENFKELNKGIGAMLDWQKEYKEQIEDLTITYKKIAEGLDRIDVTLESTAQNHQIIHETNELLKKVLVDLSSEVDSFASLGEKAKQSFPIIESNMNNLTTTANECVQENVRVLRENYKELQSTQRDLVQSYKNNIEKMITDNSERIKVLDEQLGEELTKSLNSLGNQLTSLSKHFVNDYEPLTKRLKEVVEISKHI